MGLMDDDDDEGSKWPEWLGPLLESRFFGQCQVHPNAHKRECNMFCLDCSNGPFCSLCLTSFHKDHRPIQIRRSSYHDVIRVCEIQKYMDITGVQTYVINSAKIVFLNPRPKPLTKGGANNVCTVCLRTLLHSFNFCSLACKTVGESKKQIGTEEEVGCGSDSEQVLRSLSPPSTPPQPPMAKRRKGVPRRAPTGALK